SSAVSYGTVRIASQATLLAGAGSYYIGNLTLEPNSALVLDQDGPVVLYVSDSVALRGRIQTPSGGHPDVAIVHLGTSDVTVEAPYDGAIVAPNAALVLRNVAAGHEGFFYGKDLTVDAGAVVRHRTPLAVSVAGQCTPMACHGHGTCGEDRAGGE